VRIAGAIMSFGSVRMPRMILIGCNKIERQIWRVMGRYFGRRKGFIGNVFISAKPHLTHGAMTEMLFLWNFDRPLFKIQSLAENFSAILRHETGYDSSTLSLRQ
jgi:hypothetical protein